MGKRRCMAKGGAGNVLAVGVVALCGGLQRQALTVVPEAELAQSHALGSVRGASACRRIDTLNAGSFAAVTYWPSTCGMSSQSW